jgi:hypothetical protein
MNKHAGLVTGHAYTILGTRTLGGKQLVYVRNPWSSERYTGPYSDDDKIWTDDLVKEAGLTKKDDGKFFMPVEDFKIAFTTY